MVQTYSAEWKAMTYHQYVKQLRTWSDAMARVTFRGPAPTWQEVDPTKTIIVVTTHADDFTLTAGLPALRFRKLGYRVVSVSALICREGQFVRRSEELRQEL